MSRLPAACSDSTHEMNAVIAMQRKIFDPAVPRVLSRIAGIGSASSPFTIACRSGAANT